MNRVAPRGLAPAGGYLDRNDRPGEHADSYYAATMHAAARHPPWRGDGRCDVCVVGGGYTGLSAALHLAQRGHEVVLLEANRIGWGASGRNGGQVGSGQRREPLELERMVGRERARALWDLGEAAKQLVKTLIARHGIDCDLRPGILHVDHRRRYLAHTRAHVEHLNERYGYPHIRFVPGDELRGMLGASGYHGAALDSDAAHLHPLNYALGLARAAGEAGAHLYERSRVLRVDSGAAPRVVLADGELRASHLLLACNGYLDGLMPPLAAQVMPINNYMVATEPLGETRARALIRDDVAVADSRFVVNYFRLSADRRLLFGGGESYSPRFPADIRAFVRRPLAEVFPQLADVRLEYGWGGTLAITMNRMPCLRRLGPATLAACGYSGHGVAMATLAGQLLAEVVDGSAARFDVMAAVPQPRFPGGTLLRWPLLVMGMLYYSLRDRL